MGSQPTNTRLTVAARSGATAPADRASAFLPGSKPASLFPAAKGVARGRFAAMTSTTTTIAFGGPLTGGATFSGSFGALAGRTPVLGAPIAAGGATRAQASGSVSGAVQGEIAGIMARFSPLIKDAAKRGDAVEVARLQARMQQLIREAEERGRGGKSRRGGGPGRRPTPPPRPTLG